MERTLVIIKPCSLQENIVHASDTKENAEVELNRFFKQEDYFSYASPLFPYLYAEDEIM